MTKTAMVVGPATSTEWQDDCEAMVYLLNPPYENELSMVTIASRGTDHGMFPTDFRGVTNHQDPVWYLVEFPMGTADSGEDFLADLGYQVVSGGE